MCAFRAPLVSAFARENVGSVISEILFPAVPLKSSRHVRVRVSVASRYFLYQFPAGGNFTRTLALISLRALSVSLKRTALSRHCRKKYLGKTGAPLPTSRASQVTPGSDVSAGRRKERIACCKFSRDYTKLRRGVSRGLNGRNGVAYFK